MRLRKLTPEDTDGSQYQALMYKIKKKAGWLCVICGWKSRGRAHIEIVVHHKNKNATDHRSENLVVICHDCHTVVHGFPLSYRRRKVVRERAKLIPKQPKYDGQKRVYDEKGWPA